VSHEEIKLTERDYYLFGFLVEGSRSTDKRTVHKGHLPPECTENRAERLVHAEYLYRVRSKQGIRYSLTKKEGRNRVASLSVRRNLDRISEKTV
jgi:hypothetical protein